MQSEIYQIHMRNPYVTAVLSSGLLASELNIPMFAWISGDPTVKDRTQYTTLVRTFYAIDTLGTQTHTWYDKID